MEKFTDVLRRSIEGCGRSRYAISRETGVPESVLSRFMRGEQGLSTRTIDPLVEFLDLEVRPRKRGRKRKGE
jgi:hypothetical protein